jgi:TrmH family RNA methyltransferase
MVRITSLQNPRIKNIIQLQSKSRERKKQGRFVIEGFREIQRAAAQGFPLVELYICKELIKQNNDDTDLIFSKISEVVEVPIDVFSRIAYREGSDGMIAISEARYLTLEDIRFSGNPLLIILDSVEKPGNLGAIMRTADAAGVDAVIVSDPLTDLYNPNTIRASIGCLFTRPVIVTSTTSLQKWLNDKAITCFAAVLSPDATEYDSNDFTGPTAFVMGTEATGLGFEWLEFCQKQVMIPMKGIADSLNVSASTAILVFEALRQRRQYN